MNDAARGVSRRAVSRDAHWRPLPRLRRLVGRSVTHASVPRHALGSVRRDGPCTRRTTNQPTNHCCPHPARQRVRHAPPHRHQFGRVRRARRRPCPDTAPRETPTCLVFQLSRLLPFPSRPSRAAAAAARTHHSFCFFGALSRASSRAAESDARSVVDLLVHPTGSFCGASSLSCDAGSSCSRCRRTRGSESRRAHPVSFCLALPCLASPRLASPCLASPCLASPCLTLQCSALHCNIALRIAFTFRPSDRHCDDRRTSPAGSRRSRTCRAAKPSCRCSPSHDAKQTQTQTQTQTQKQKEVGSHPPTQAEPSS